MYMIGIIHSIYSCYELLMVTINGSILNLTSQELIILIKKMPRQLTDDYFINACFYLPGFSKTHDHNISQLQFHTAMYSGSLNPS